MHACPLATGTPRMDNSLEGWANAMAEYPLPTKATIARVLERAGYSTDLIEEILTLFHDPVDEAQLEVAFRRYGLTRDVLTSRFGGSP